MLTILSRSILFSLVLSIHSFGQSSFQMGQDKSAINKDALDQKLDSLFSSFNINTPGVAVTVLEEGKVIAEKAYGMANLEFGVPFSQNTIVRMQYAEGREFIAIAAAVMEQEGLLSFEDKVGKYFPDLPEWSEPVTIRDLLNHRSGFVDEWSVLLLTQASMSNRVDVTQFLNLLYNQPAPGFEPGKGYMYCNSDFGLLRLILEKATGENLSDWMSRRMFEPLGMHSTRLHDNKDEVIAGFAHEYDANGNGGYLRWTNDKTSPGGNYYIATSAADLKKWANIHADPNSFANKSMQYLKKDAVLMPGTGKNYVFGIKEHAEDGYTLITHQGVNDRPYLSRYPPKGYAVIVLGNTGADYVQFHQAIMNWLVGIEKKVFKNKIFPPASVKYTKAELQQFAGRYFDADTLGYESFTKDRKNLLHLIIQNDSLKWKLDNSTIIPLEQVSRNVFKDSEYEAYMEFDLPQNKNENVRISTHVYPDNKVFYHIKDTSALWAASKEELISIEGTYYSSHLDFYWKLIVNQEGKLILKRPTISDTELIPDTKDVFTLQVEKWPGIPSFEVLVNVHRDDSWQITHLTVSDPRLINHRFDKLR